MQRQQEILFGTSPIPETNRRVEGQLLEILGDHFYVIENAQEMLPFLMSIVSNTDHSPGRARCARGQRTDRLPTLAAPPKRVSSVLWTISSLRHPRRSTDHRARTEHSCLHVLSGARDLPWERRPEDRMDTSGWSDLSRGGRQAQSGGLRGDRRPHGSDSARGCLHDAGTVTAGQASRGL